MVHSEVYDISPELSAVTLLLREGIDVWLVDFGAPERQRGGMGRTLDDHVLAIDRAIDEVKTQTGRDVHLAGYSQGGIFCYEVVAYRRSRDVASVITFGAPVNIYRNLPLKIHEDIAGIVLKVAGHAAKVPLKRFEGFSATLTSASFKLLYPANELKHLALLVGHLPNRRVLEQVVPKRRFLGGEGFVAWPGPAFRDFFAQVVAENRLASGGLKIGRRSVTLSDITCPVLYFYGAADNLARPSAVKGIEKATPQAEHDCVEIDSGHFGLVVGTKALERSWPLVIEWLRWRAGLQERPAGLVRRDTRGHRHVSTKRLTPTLLKNASDVVDALRRKLGTMP
jgi:putative long chain acyl-CoA synthase